MIDLLGLILITFLANGLGKIILLKLSLNDLENIMIRLALGFGILSTLIWIAGMLQILYIEFIELNASRNLYP